MYIMKLLVRLARPLLALCYSDDEQLYCDVFRVKRALLCSQ